MLYKKLLIVVAVIFCLITNFGCISIKTQKETSADKTNREAKVENSVTQRSVSVKTTANEKEIYDKSYALVIGVSQYTNWNSLPGVKIDVSLVSKALERQGFDVQIVMDPTRTGFDETMRKFISDYGLSPKNRLLIYFAGHGHTITTPDNRKLGYIVPSDAALPEDLSSFLNKAISMQEIMVYAKQIQSNHAIFLFDSCFSGSLFRGDEDTPDLISSELAKPVRQFITAGNENQQVPDDSIFRQQFISGIEGKADLNKDGYVIGSELGRFLEKTVASYSNKSQTPIYGKINDSALDKGDFIFGQKVIVQELAANNPTPPSIQSPQSPFSVERNNVTYKLIQAERNGNEVIFWFIALNKGGDLKTGLYFNCSLTDKNGKEHRISERIAGGRRGGLDWLSFSIPYNVPTRFGLAFDSLPYDTKQVPFLRTKLEDGEVQFRNIPVPYN